MTLVTVPELSSYMSGSPITVQQTQSAELILAGVQSELEMYINRQLEPHDARELVCTDTRGFARLRSAPIHAVTKVILVRSSSLSPVTLRDFPIEDVISDPDSTLYDFTPANLGAGMITTGGVMLGSPNSYFIVEYRGGGGDAIKSYLPSIKLAIMRVASREWEHLHDDSVKINNGEIGESVDPGVAKLRGWSTEELMKFDRIRRRAIV